MSVHFPIALLSTSVLWDGLGLWTGAAVWWTLGYWTLGAGLVASLPAIATGFLEFVRLPPDAPAETLATWHLMLTGTAVASFLGSLLVRGGTDPLVGGRLMGALTCSIIGLGLLGIGGHLGAKLVYEYGIGSAPPTDSD